MTMNRFEMLSSRFANLGFVCACLVVSMHIHSPWEGVGFGIVAVPFFFLMSGYFLATHVDDPNWYKMALKKRVRTLLVPYLIWCALWLCYSAPIAIILNLISGRELFANLPKGILILRWFGLHPIYEPSLGALWYLRCLLIFALISPIVVWLIRRVGVWVPLLLFAVFVGYKLVGVQNESVVRFFRFGFCLEGVGYFTLGIYLRIKNSNLLCLNRFVSTMILAIGILVYLKVCVWLSVSLMMIGLWGVMPNRRLPGFLVKNAFAVYLLHMFVLLLIGSKHINSVSVSIVMTIVSVVITIGLVESLRRVFPRFCCIALGGR